MQREIGPRSPRIKHLEKCICMRLRGYCLLDEWMHFGCLRLNWIYFFSVSSFVDRNNLFVFFWSTKSKKMLFCCTCWCNWYHLRRSFKSLEISNYFLFLTTFQFRYVLSMQTGNCKHYSFIIIVICPFPN